MALRKSHTKCTKPTEPLKFIGDSSAWFERGRTLRTLVSSVVVYRYIMEALSEILQPYKGIVGATAGVVTAMQMFSGAFLCWDIKKRGSSDIFSIIPFIGGSVMGILNLKYGTLIRDDTVIKVNLLGLFLNIIYLSVFYIYATNKGQVWTKLGSSGAFAAATLAYTEMEDPSLVENRLGIIITAILFALIGSPLFFLPSIFRKKSTEGMPFPMILSATFVTFLWGVYGIIIRNNFLVFQNSVAFAMTAFQLSLFAIFPSTPEKTSKKLNTKKTN